MGAMLNIEKYKDKIIRNFTEQDICLFVDKDTNAVIIPSYGADCTGCKFFSHNNKYATCGDKVARYLLEECKE